MLGLPHLTTTTVNATVLTTYPQQIDWQLQVRAVPNIWAGEPTAPQSGNLAYLHSLTDLLLLLFAT